MNQDFLIPASPGLARRMVRVSKICRMDLDPAIAEIAKEDLLSDEDFADSFLGISERAVVQQIFDHDFRAVVPAYNMRAMHVAIEAIKLAKLSPVVIFTKYVKNWKVVAQNHGFKIDENFFIIPANAKTVDPDMVKATRHGVFIIDEPGSGGYLNRESVASMLSRDFPKTLVVCDNRNVFDLETAASILSPGCPVGVLNVNNPFFRRDLETRGFTTSVPEELSILLNIIPELLTISQSELVEQIDNEDEEEEEDLGIPTVDLLFL